MITGKVTSVYGADINTDDIIPAMHLQQSTERAFFAEHAFSKFDEEFRERCRQAEKNIIVAGENFGCGSSREQAVYALAHNNVACVIAPSFPDIFHRNCLTNGLTLIVLEDTSGFDLGHDLIVDLANGHIENHSTGERHPFEMNDHVREIFMQGGMVGRVRQHLEEILSAG